MKRLLVTTGDPAGIGLEVTRKAINSIPLRANTQLIIVAKDCALAEKEWARLRAHVRLTTDAWGLISAHALPTKQVLVLPSKLAASLWFDRGIDLAKHGHIDAIVTGPLTKKSFCRAGLAVMGHTGLLAEKTRRLVFQGYRGDDLNVVLATDHVSLSAVESLLTKRRVLAALAAAEELRTSLPGSQRKRPIAVLGLNPHAGESGHIGKFETRLRNWLPRQVIGPLSPDAAFTPAARATYSVAIALYHDQGLIPFKMLHGQYSGFQVSLGIPFVRTSVDHGTAFDIAGKNVAHSGSMASAITGALDLLKSRKHL